MLDKPAPFPFQIIGFDLDGTLLDTSGDLAEATNYALASIGRAPLSLAEIRPMIGGGAKMMLQRGLEASGGCDAALLKQLTPLFMEHYEAHISALTLPFDGLTEALDCFDEMGVQVAVVTNKLERFAVKLLDEIGMIERFACVIGGDTMGPGKAKPHPAPIHEMIARCGGGTAAFIGDSHFDIEAAKNASIPSIAVSFGFLQQPVESLGADAIIDHYAELIPTLKSLNVQTL